MQTEFDALMKGAIESQSQLRIQPPVMKEGMVIGAKLFLRMLVELAKMDPDISLANALLTYAKMSSKEAKR